MTRYQINRSNIGLEHNVTDDEIGLDLGFLFALTALPEMPAVSVSETNSNERTEPVGQPTTMVDFTDLRDITISFAGEPCRCCAKGWG